MIAGNQLSLADEDIGAATVARLRLALAALGVLGLLIAAPGLAAHELFNQPSLTKYIVTLALPALVTVVAFSRSPLRVCVGVAIVGAPLATEAATFGGVTIPLGVVTLGAAVAVASCMAPLRRGISPLGRAAFVGLLLIAVPILAGADPLYSIVWLGAMLATAWLVATVCLERTGVRFVCMAVVASAAIQAAIAIYEYKTGHELNLYGAAGSESFGSSYFYNFGGVDRPVGLFPDPIALGNVLALSLPLAIYCACTHPSRYGRWAVVAASALITGGLLLSLSRMSWIGATAGVALTVAMLPPAQRRRAATGIAAVVLMLVVFGGSTFGPSLAKRAETIFSPTSGQNSHSESNPGEDVGRIRIWGAALSIFEENPVVGVGANRIIPLLAARTGGISQYSQAQSVFLQVLAEMGVAGALALILLIAVAGRTVIRAGPGDRVLAAALAGSLLAILVGWTTDYTVHEVPVGITEATVFGMIAALSSRRAPGRGRGVELRSA